MSKQTRFSRGITIAEAIEQMRTGIKMRDLSDEHLAERGLPTRQEVFAMEYPYGITVVPSTFALKLAERLLKLTGNGNEVIPYD